MRQGKVGNRRKTRKARAKSKQKQVSRGFDDRAERIHRRGPAIVDGQGLSSGIDQYAGNTSRLRTGNVEMRRIPHMQRFTRRDPMPYERELEDARVRLG